MSGAGFFEIGGLGAAFETELFTLGFELVRRAFAHEAERINRAQRKNRFASIFASVNFLGLIAQPLCHQIR